MDISLSKIQRIMMKAFWPEYKSAAEKKHVRLKKFSRTTRIIAGVIGWTSLACIVAAPIALFGFGAPIMTAAALAAGGVCGMFFSTPFSAMSDGAQKLIWFKGKKELKADIRNGALLDRYQAECLPQLEKQAPELAAKISSLSAQNLKAAFDAVKKPVPKWVKQIFQKPALSLKK